MVVQRGNVASLLGTMGHLAISDIFKFFLVVIVFVGYCIVQCIVLRMYYNCIMYCIMIALYCILYYDIILYCIMYVLYVLFIVFVFIYLKKYIC